MIEHFLREKVKGFEIRGEGMEIQEALKMYGDLSFQARNLNTAFNIYRKMLQNRCTIFLGVAGALVPAGLRKVFIHMIRERFCDVIVSTGANLFHDCHESLGYHHYKGAHDVDDDELYSHGVDRIYDTFASEAEFQKTENFIEDFSLSLPGRGYSTREFLYLLGKKVSGIAVEPGILTEAYRMGVPIFCPAVADSSIGIALGDARVMKKGEIFVDCIKDVNETAWIVSGAGATGVVYLSGGIPKNFIQQAALIPWKRDRVNFAHRYAIQITMDQPHWGGLSGCTLKEAKSWGKVHRDANYVTLYSEVTLILPILIQALSSEAGRGKFPSGEMPLFEFEEEGVRISWKNRLER